MVLIETQKEEFSRLKDIRIFGKEDNQVHFNKDMLVIGLGGAGGRVVAGLKGMLMDSITPEDNINFLLIDSDIPFMENMIEDSKEGVGLNALEIISTYRPNIDNVLANGIKNNPIHPNLANWMREDFPAISLGTDGAKGNRQIGRLMFSNAYEDVKILLFDRVKEIYEKSETGKLDIIIVSSVAGGTGSSIIADVTYNIKALARVKKWQNVRIGGCLLMPDCFFGQRVIYDDPEKVRLLNANGCATLKEIDYLMRVEDKAEGFLFESTTHKLSMKDNIFDACMLVSGKKDEQGYIPEGVIFSDTAYFLYKLATNKFIGGNEDGQDRQLLRDVFFAKDAKGYYKIINEADYRVPIKEIENICEYTLFDEAYKRIHSTDIDKEKISKDMEVLFEEIQSFLLGKPGEEINLKINGLIRTSQVEKPLYKNIKKGNDELRSSMGRQLNTLKQDMPIIIKSVKNRLFSDLNSQIDTYMRTYGPFVTLNIIGAEGYGGLELDGGMIVEIKKLEELQKAYQPTGEFSRIIESIKSFVSKKLFAFPSAKREAEDGYYDACIKETLATERTLIVDGFDGQDVFGDAIRLLRQKAERISDIYSQFDQDLKYAVEDLATRGKRTIDYLLKAAPNRDFFPSDYVTEARIDEVRKGIISLMVDNESNIDNGRVVQVKENLEKVYKNALIGIGVYAPEKLIAVAFSPEKLTLMDTNVMFVSPTNDRREELMRDIAKAFVEGSKEKTQKKKLCIIKEGYEANLINKRYISLPNAMPYFSKAVKELYTSEPYMEDVNNIALNKGEIEISVDDMYIGVPLSHLDCAKDMQEAYDNVDTNLYFGLHVDEVNKNMREYPNIA